MVSCYRLDFTVNGFFKIREINASDPERHAKIDIRENSLTATNAMINFDMIPSNYTRLDLTDSEIYVQQPRSGRLVLALALPENLECFSMNSCQITQTLCLRVTTGDLTFKELAFGCVYIVIGENSKGLTINIMNPKGTTHFKDMTFH